jgi:hypothetical protein
MSIAKHSIARSASAGKHRARPLGEQNGRPLRIRQIEETRGGNSGARHVANVANRPKSGRLDGCAGTKLLLNEDAETVHCTSMPPSSVRPTPGHLSCLSNAFRYTPATQAKIANTFARIAQRIRNSESTRRQFCAVVPPSVSRIAPTIAAAVRG